MRSLQRGAVAALLVTTAVAVAACGGSGSSASSTSTTGTTSTSAAGAAGGANSAAMAKYTACLKQNGVTLPAGGPGGGAGGGGQGGTPPTGTNAQGGAPRPGGNANFRKAAAACAKLRPAGLRAGGFGGRGGGNGANNAAFAAYRNCLTLHGVNASALNPGAAGSSKPTAKVQKAMTACASLRPQGQAPSSPTATAPITTTS